MNAPLFIARQHVTTLMRQKETLLWTFVMPFVFFYFIGTVTGGDAMQIPTERRDGISLENSEGAGFLFEQLAERLEAENYIVSVRASDDPVAEKFTRRLILPAKPDGYENLSEAVLDGQHAELTWRRKGDGPGVQLDKIRVGRAVYGLLADMVVAGEDGEIDAASLAAISNEERLLTLSVEHAGNRVHIPTGYEQTIPGTTVMFTMMILLTGGAILIVIERQQGLFRRLASTPITRGQLVAGKWLGMLGLATVQLSFAMIAGSLFFGMDWGPDLWMVVVVLFVWAAFNSSLGMLLSSFARSEAQMNGVAVLASMVLAALGGCWWPIEVTPDWMQSLALFLPTGWAMDALHHLVSFGDGPASVLPHLAILSVSSVLLGLLAVKNFRYQ